MYGIQYEEDINQFKMFLSVLPDYYGEAKS